MWLHGKVKCRGGGCGSEVWCSDREGNKAVVLLDVPLQDVGAGSQDSLKPRPVQFHTLQRSARSHGGSAGPVHQQGDLTWTRKKKKNSLSQFYIRGALWDKKKIQCDEG